MKPRPKPTKNPRRVMTSRCGCKSCGQGLECAAAIDRMPPHATATADARLRPSEIAVAPAVGRREAADGRREEVCVGGSDIGWAGQGWAGEARQGRPPPHDDGVSSLILDYNERRGVRNSDERGEERGEWRMNE